MKIEMALQTLKKAGYYLFVGYLIYLYLCLMVQRLGIYGEFLSWLSS